MKRFLALILVLLFAFSLFGCTRTADETLAANDNNDREEVQQTDENDEAAVISLVEDFGKRLQNVSLQAPKDLLEKSIKENYDNYVSKELMDKWINDPLKAPGRLTSSPWPDRIQIKGIKKLAENQYEVKGEIIEITSVEQVSGGAAAKREITLIADKVNGKWIIDDVVLGSYEITKYIEYTNNQYGFGFKLPISWMNYSIINEKWEGLSLADSEGEKIIESGPIIAIRHPLWTSEKPRQDIPIMIFTAAQWNSLQKEQFHIGAAPIGPSELARNDKYVFALPARYNYAFPEGYEEVEDILKENPLEPFEVK